MRRAIAGALVGIALLSAGCGATASAAPHAGAPAATIVMANAPQKVAPQAYMADFVDAKAAHQLIDVRTPAEYASGHIAGSVNIPVEELASRLNEVSKDEPVVLYCRSGNRSNQAANILNQAGYKGVYDLGGIGAWQAAGYGLQ